MSNRDRSRGEGAEIAERKFPDPMVIIFAVLIISGLMGAFIPEGSFERILVDGRERVVANSFSFTDTSGSVFSLGGLLNKVFSVFTAIPRGMLAAAPYLFIVFIAGGLFAVISKSNALENAIGTTIKHVGLERRWLVIWLATYLYGAFGITVGFENNIALVPVAMIISAAIGYSNLVGVCIAVGGLGVGFALSPINPYTVGTAQGIAGLPLFSGALFRSILCFAALSLLALFITVSVARRSDAQRDDTDKNGLRLSKNLHEYTMNMRDALILSVFVAGITIIAICSYLAGTGQLGRSWFINEIATVFLIISMLVAAICRMNANDYVSTMVEGAAGVTGGALTIGLAASIGVVLKDAQIIDTIINALNQLVVDVPLQFLAIALSVVQGVINFFIPSGSAQALITMPILIPLSDLTGMSRQLMILSFQVGDGLTNLIIPTSGGTLAMLALGRVSFAKWIAVITPFMLAAYALSWVFLIIAHYINW